MRKVVAYIFCYVRLISANPNHVSAIIPNHLSQFNNTAAGCQEVWQRANWKNKNNWSGILAELTNNCETVLKFFAFF